MIRGLGFAMTGLALVAAQPAWAGPADEVGRMGAFAGARVRLSLGGAKREPLRAGLTLTGTRMLQRADGRAQSRLGEGIEFGFGGRRSAPAFSFAGQPLGERGPRRSLTTSQTVAVVAGGVLLAAGIGYLVLVHEIDKNSE